MREGKIPSTPAAYAAPLCHAKKVFRSGDETGFPCSAWLIQCDTDSRPSSRGSIFEKFGMLLLGVQIVLHGGKETVHIFQSVSTALLGWVGGAASAALTCSGKVLPPSILGMLTGICVNAASGF